MKRAWGWLLVAGLALVILLAPLPAAVSYPLNAAHSGGTTNPVERVYRVSAERFAYSPSILHANPGDRVTIELVAADVVHGLSIDGYGVSISADPGQTKSITFAADKAGVYRFRCTVTCGNLHPFMIGKLQVGPNTTLWRAVGLSLLALAAGFWRLRA